MTEGLFIATLVGLFTVVACAEGLCLAKVYRRIRVKGYRSPLVVMALAMPAFVVGIAGMIVYGTVDPIMRTTGSSPIRLDEAGTSLLRFCIFVALPLALFATAASVVAWRLPVRRARIYGARRVRFPWHFAARALFALMAIIVLRCLLVGTGYYLAMKLVYQGFLPATIYCFFMARRARAPGLDAALANDPRAPVLYLRAFSHEGEVFSSDALRFGRYGLNPAGSTFEQFFSKSICEHIGPFVALGSPEDYLPPEGAFRTYVDDRHWTDRFKALSAAAGCILMEIDQSDNLRWELSSLREACLHEKLYVLTRPREKRRRRGKSVQWPDFAGALHTLGYSLTAEDPGPGAVIAFDPDGSGSVIGRDAGTPLDYVVPIVQRLTSADEGSRRVAS